MARTIPDEGGGSGDMHPTALLKEAGAMLKGVMLGKRDVKTKFGPKPVFSFKVLDASCKFTTGKEKTEVQPNEGDTVDAFAPTRLARQLAHVTQGETVTIKYLGRKQIGIGQPAHVFEVEVA